MSYKKFLVPVGVAVAALISSRSHAVQTPPQLPTLPLERGNIVSAIRESGDPVIEKLLYQIGADQHALTLHKPASGVVYAQHGSHESHGSHGSHQSHRSGN